MTMIAEKDRPTVRDVLARELVDDVELLLFTRGRSSQPAQWGHAIQSSAETRELLEELVGLSDRLHLTPHDITADPDTATLYNVAAVPTVIVRRRSIARTLGAGVVDLSATRQDTNVRFVGLPGGYEFSTLVADILDVSKGRTDLSPAARETVRAISSPVHVQVFVTPSCPYCPPVARLAHQLAMENPLIVSEVIEANEFQDLSERYRVRTVPKTIINDRIEFVGPLPEAKVLEALQQAVRHDG